MTDEKESANRMGGTRVSKTSKLLTRVPRAPGVHVFITQHIQEHKMNKHDQIISRYM